MNMYLHELKSLRKTTLIWTVAIIAVAALYLSIYPGIAKDAADFKKMLEGYPPAVRAALGLSLDSITSLLGFYCISFTYIILCGAIQAMNIGVSLLTKETRGRTSDFLFTKPVSRTAVLNAKLLAALTSLIITNVIYLAAAYAIACAVKTANFSAKKFLLVSITLFFVQLIFLSIGLFASVAIPRLKSVLPVSLGTVFGFFFIGMLLATATDSSLRFLSPFKYYDTAYILKHSAFEAPFLILSACIVVAATAASYFICSKKDIHAVS